MRRAQRAAAELVVAGIRLRHHAHHGAALAVGARGQLPGPPAATASPEPGQAADQEPQALLSRHAACCASWSAFARRRRSSTTRCAARSSRRSSSRSCTRTSCTAASRRSCTSGATRPGTRSTASIDLGSRQIGVEAKSGETIAEDFFDGLRYWRGLAPPHASDVQRSFTAAIAVSCRTRSSSIHGSFCRAAGREWPTSGWGCCADQAFTTSTVVPRGREVHAMMVQPSFQCVTPWFARSSLEPWRPRPRTRPDWLAPPARTAATAREPSARYA